MQGLRTVRIVMAAALVTLGASNVSAQVLGPFTWQMQPYCNIVRLTLTGTPIGYTADGTDDQCGGASLASAVGVANFNVFGLVVINFTIVTPPSGGAVHVSATINTGNGNGTWTDSLGNSGTFAFAAATPALPPRPASTSGVAPASITSVEIAPAAVGAVQIATNAVGASEIAAGAVGASEIAAGAVRADALGTITRRSATNAAVGPGAVESATASCLAGERVISGGNDASFDIVVVASRDSGNGWEVFGRNNAAANRSITAHVYCLAP